MMTCDSRSADAVEVELLDSNDHVATLEYANGLVYVGYNEGRGPIIQMFCRIRHAAMEAVAAPTVVLHAVNKALAQQGKPSMRCRRVELLTPINS